MRIVVTGIPETQPIVIEDAVAIVLAASNGHQAPVISFGRTGGDVVALAILVLHDVRDPLGDEAFEFAVHHARTNIPFRDFTEQTRDPD